MSPLNLLLIIASLLGCVTFFLPFASGISPLAGLQDVGLWRLAVPFLIPFIAMIARGAQLQYGKLSQGATWIVYFWVIVTVLITLSIYAPIGDGLTWPSTGREWLPFAAPLVTLIVCGIMWRRSRGGADANRPPMLALRVAYLPNAVLCLFAFLPDTPNIGAWLALGTSVVYLADVIAG